MPRNLNDGEAIDAAKRFAPSFVTSMDELQDMVRSVLFGSDAKPEHTASCMGMFDIFDEALEEH